MLSVYKTLIEQMFADRVILTQENQTSFSPAVQAYVDILMMYTDSVKNMENYKTQFTLEMSKASLFHTIGKTDIALQILEIINSCDHDSVQKAILSSEIESLSTVLERQSQPIWALLSDSLISNVDSTLFIFDYESIIDSSGFGSFIENPNTGYFSACDLSQGPIYSALSQFGVSMAWSLNSLFIPIRRKAKFMFCRKMSLMQKTVRRRFSHCLI
jgi:hypothetical protein